ncbi:MAG: dihydrodipicolinate reductase [Chloroflexi bacterium]|nr:dihydrodipicolinate reductase [Chloroflexota bacterium]
MIPVIHFGLGPIGRTIGKVVAEEGRLQSAAAVDVDPAIVGRRLDEICDADLPPLVVVDSLDAVAVPAGAVLLQATVSQMTAAREQLLEAIERGFHVVSTCEELVWPWDDHPRLADEIDAAARNAGVTVLGVGVNPGFVMDLLPALAARATIEIEAVHISRYVDLRERRLALRQKMGVGRDPAWVQRMVDEERMGHVGLALSAHMLAASLGWRLDVVDIENRAIAATDSTVVEMDEVLPGQCIGVWQKVTGIVRGMPRIFLTLIMQLDVEGGSRDEILIDGEQCLRLRIDGLHGDRATAALVVNQALHVRNMPPGLQTMLTAPLLPRASKP